jgi:hypothetical protein
METLAGAFDLTAALQSRGIDFVELGAAYLVFLASCAATAAVFFAARAHLVVAPNRQARDYAVYVCAVLLTLLIATALENELVSVGVPTLRYVAYPQILFLLALHLWILYRPHEPWIIELGASSIVASVTVAAVAAAAAGAFRAAHGVTVVVFAGLLGFLWRQAISTKRAFVNADSIYLRSKENLDPAATPQKPWLGLPHWAALVVASVLLAIANSLLRGRGIEQIPAVEVALESTLLLSITALVCAVPATSYWIARKAWMPELTRFVWLVWLVVGFAFTYGNYLTSLGKV